MDNKDLVQPVDNYDLLHHDIWQMNAVYGKGRAVAIVWDERNYDHTKTKLLRGTVVVQLQYGQQAFKFSVELRDHGEYVICFRGKRHTVKSYYFENR